MTFGSLDAFYACLVLASTAVAMDKEVRVFCAGNSIKCLYKDLSALRLNPIENEGMVMRLPFGPKWLKKVDWNAVLPRFVWLLPGARYLATTFFRKALQAKNQPSIVEMRDICLELGVQFTVCSMTLDLTGQDKEYLIDSIEVAGAASYFADSMPSQSLYL